MFYFISFALSVTLVIKMYPFQNPFFDPLLCTLNARDEVLLESLSLSCNYHQLPFCLLLFEPLPKANVKFSKSSNLLSWKST